jgi:hypothetical protein
MRESRLAKVRGVIIVDTHHFLSAMCLHQKVWVLIGNEKNFWVINGDELIGEVASSPIY